MSRIALAWELGGGLGHCANLVPIAARLTANGHAVAVIAREVAAAYQAFNAVPVMLFQALTVVENQPRVVAPQRTFADVLHNTGFGSDDQLISRVHAWRNLFAAIGPDVVVCEHAPTALLASRWFDCRRVVAGTGFFAPPDVCPLPGMRYWETAADETSENNIECALLDRINRLLNESSLPLMQRLGELYGDVDDSLLLTFEELDHYPQRASSAYWGMWSMEGGSPVQWPNGPGPRVFGYLKQTDPNWRPDDVLALIREFGLTAVDAALAHSGSQSTHDAYSFADAFALGTPEFQTVPVGGADSISIEFSEDVTVAKNDFTLWGNYTEQYYDVSGSTFNYGERLQDCSRNNSRSSSPFAPRKGALTRRGCEFFDWD